MAGDLAASGSLYAALAAIGPLVWTLVDLAVTGNPLFSLLYTSGSAEDLGRQRTLSQLPTAIPGFFNILVKLPLMIAALVGFGIALVMRAAADGDAARAARVRRSGRSC